MHVVADTDFLSAFFKIKRIELIYEKNRACFAR